MEYKNIKLAAEKASKLEQIRFIEEQIEKKMSYSTEVNCNLESYPAVTVSKKLFLAMLLAAKEELLAELKNLGTVL